MKNVPYMMDGGGVFPSAWLERAITSAPAFREKGLTLLRGILPDEVTGRQVPPRTQAQWGQRLIPYVILQGDMPLAALEPEPRSGGEDETLPFGMGTASLTEDPALAVPGLLRLTCPVETGEDVPEEGPVRTMLALLLTMPKSGTELAACQMTKLPRRLAGELLKLELLREEQDERGKLQLVPTEFGAECGLVASWRWNGDKVSRGVACHPRSLPFLEELVEDWLGEGAVGCHRGPKPLERRLERMRDGFYGSPAQNEVRFTDWQELELGEVVGEERAESLRRELDLSSDVTWSQAGAAFYRHQADADQAWSDGYPVMDELRMLCPMIREERWER